MTTNKIQVKDTSNYVALFLLIAMFPFIFMFFSNYCGYVWGVVITCLVYVLIVLALVRYIKSEKYAIEADDEQIKLYQYGSFKWEQISKIEAVRETKTTLKSRLYLKIYFAEGKVISINTSNFDMYGEELAQKLRQLGKLQ
jgi:Ca2+/Na+ antiporter